MPDLKFDGNFYFSANSPSKGHPLLVPVISNPDFVKTGSIPGILELINGDLGITEKIMSPVLNPIISQMTCNPLMAESIANVNGLEKNNPDAIKGFLLSQYIPKDFGLKPLEKTIITSMMESFKPLMEFLKIFLQTLGVAEDIVCRFLGSYIKVLGVEIGMKSRSPYYWDESLGYTETITHALKQMLDASDKAAAVMDSSISDKNPIKNSVTGAAKDKATGDTDLPAYYVAYFDENGKAVEPPLWVKNSNKWFSKTIQDRDGKLVTIGAPFTQLSDNLNEGVAELRKRQTNQLASMEQEKEDMLKNISDRLKEAEKITDAEEKKNEIDSIEAEKKQASKMMDDLIQAIRDIIDGSNKAGGNFVDDNDLSKGVNPPAIINEWIAKSRGAQFRGKYYPDQKTTIQSLINNKGDAIEPYVFIPKFGVNYKGKNYNIEVPLAFDNQIQKNKTYSNAIFFDSKETEFDDFRIRHFSNINVVTSLNLNPQNQKKPFEAVNKTHFSNDIKQEYVPDNIKRFYLPLEWEEVLEYETISKSTGKVLKVEKEFVPFKIDVENDYELRLIKVINLPLLATGANNPIDNFFPDSNGELIMYVKDNYIQFLKTNKDVKQLNIKIDYPSSGTSGNGQAIIIPSNKFSHGTRYVDETAFVDEAYFYLRKDTRWGRDFIDSDDSEIYQVKNINKSFKTISVINVNEVINIDNTLKTITFNSIVNIPSYITEYSYGNNFTIVNTNSSNNNVSVKITSIEIINNQTTLKYEGNLITETINRSFSFQYIDSSFVETYQFFTGAENFTASIFTILDINYLPDAIKNGNKSIIIQGFDSNSLLSTLSDRVNKVGNDITQFIKPNPEADNIYKILKIEKLKTRKGVDVTSLKLDFPIPQQYTNKAYSSNTTLGFYYPLRIYTVPQVNNQGAGNSSSAGLTTGTGTLYTKNNNIPANLNIDDPDSTIHSPSDINEKNLLKEGIVYQGLDPRFVDRNKWKVFYLVEAIKKGNDGVAAINGKPTEPKKQLKGVQGGGKEWYGLIDKFTAIPMVISKLVPLIAGKIIPLAVKIIQLVSNPKKIKDLLLDIGLMNEDISKFPKNFSAFAKSGFIGKEKDIAKQKLPKNFTDYNKKKNKNKKEASLYYAGPQLDNPNGKPIFMLDGQALAEFGKGAFGKPLVSFGAELKEGELKPIASLKKNISVNKMPEIRDQGIFNMILNFVKLPFEIIFKIFKWIIDWIKKLLNPAKIPAALSEFLSFKWLLDILGKDSIFGIMGLVDVAGIQDKIDDLIKNISGIKAQELFNDIMKTIRGNKLNFVEVFIYDILKNGVKINQEIVERPFSNGDLTDVKNPNGADASLADITNALNGLGLNPFGFCGSRDFSIAKLFPVPFFNTDIAFNNCELPILFLKPLELIAGLMTFIQNLLNGFLSMPTSILGLDPTIPIPKFGKEIPFANILTEIIDKLKAAIPQIKTGASNTKPLPPSIC